MGQTLSFGTLVPSLVYQRFRIFDWLVEVPQQIDAEGQREPDPCLIAFFSR